MTAPTNVEAAILLNNAWVTVTGGTYNTRSRDPINITHGRRNWAGKSDPGRASFTLDSRSHEWAPDDVSAAFWRTYRRNIPCRVGVGTGTTFLESQGRPNGGGSGAFCASSAALQITGSIDVRIEFQLYEDPWDRDVVFGANVVYSQLDLIEKYGVGGGWRMGLVDESGQLGIMWDWVDNGSFVNGTVSNNVGVSLPYWARYRRVTVRTTFEPATGTVTYYYGTAGVAGAFTLLGSEVLGATTLKAGTDQVRVSGNTDSFNWRPFPGRTFAAQIRNLGGSTVASPVFEGAAVGASSVTDSQGNVFSMGSGGRITNMRWRFHGELASLPIRTNVRGNDIYAPVEAAGLLRRLHKGQPVLESPIRRAVTRKAFAVKAYWPMEESGNKLLQFGAAVNTQPMVVVNGVYPTTSSNKDFDCSAPLPQMGSSVYEARVDAYSGTEWQIRFLMSMSATLVGTDLQIVQWATTDMDWQILWRSTDGAMKIQASRAGTAVYDSGYIAFGILTGPSRFVRVHVSVTINGANVDVNFQTQTPGGVSAGVLVLNAVAGVPGVVTLIRFNPAGNLTDTAIGHVTIQSQETSTTELAAELNAFIGEKAGVRANRLAAEEGLSLRMIGNPTDTVQMGAQGRRTLIDLLDECADADLGILGESRDSLGLLFRCRSDMTAQSVKAALSYTAGYMADVIELDRDDQGFTNDWTVTGPTGATARAQLDDGTAISVSEPPTGAGRYADSGNVNVLEDRLPSMAYSMLRFTAVDQPRVTNLAVGMDRAPMVAAPTLAVQILELVQGDLVTTTSVGNYTGTLSQILQGTEDKITATQHEIRMLTTSGVPWSTGIVEDATYVGRYDTAGSSLAASAIAGATSLSVATTLGPLWTTNGADLPFDVLINGVRVTVTAISGAASPQTFTVTAISRALNSGDTVVLADPTYYELG